jgi:hypothetical protein
MKNRPVGAELFHAYGWTSGPFGLLTEGPTDTTNLIVTFRDNVKAPKGFS